MYWLARSEGMAWRQNLRGRHQSVRTGIGGRVKGLKDMSPGRKKKVTAKKEPKKPYKNRQGGGDVAVSAMEGEKGGETRQPEGIGQRKKKNCGGK